MFAHFTSLRTRLVAAFLLVSVPPMLLAAYVAASLISSAFEGNVQQWLEETSRYLQMQVRENQIEASRLAALLPSRFISSGFLEHPEDTSRIADLNFVFATGYDLVVLDDDTGKRLYVSYQIGPSAQFALKTQDVVQSLPLPEGQKILAGATQQFEYLGRQYFVTVGSWVDEETFGGVKIVSSLDLRLYALASGQMVPIFAANSDNKDQPLSATILRRIAAKDEMVYDDNEDSSTYRAVYSGLRDSNGTLVGVIFAGLARQDSFFPRIDAWGLFLGMFLLGSLLSILTGLWMSGLLVRPLRALSSGVRSVAAGDYRPRVPPVGSSEMRELAQGFNIMADRLSSLRELEEELRRKDRFSALGQAAMVIAHEVRNPLGIIQASTEVVRSKAALDPSQTKLLGYVVDEVRRIEELIRGFLDFARPNEPVKAQLSLHAVLERVANFAGLEFERRKIVFALEPQVAEAQIYGDADMIYQALLNLVLNAMDAMAHGGRMIGRIRKSDGFYEISIIDNGLGVSPTARAKLFDPFFTTKTKGSGLGLAKVRTVAEAHGGRVAYHPAEGGGSIFSIILPATKVPPTGSGVEA